MDMGVRKLPKKRKFDPAELDEGVQPSTCIAVSVVQTHPSVTTTDYHFNHQKHPVAPLLPPVDLSEWCDHRVLAKQGDWYLPGVIREAGVDSVSQNISLNTYVCIILRLVIIYVMSDSIAAYLKELSVTTKTRK